MKKKAIQDKIETLERAINSPATSAEHREAMKEQLEKLRNTSTESQSDSKPAKVKKAKSAAPKEPVKKEKKAKRKISPEECAEILKETEARRKKFKDSGRKYRTKPVSQKVASNIATATKQAIDNIPAKKIDEDPVGMIQKIEKLEKSANEFFADFRSVLGEDYDKNEAAKELGKIHSLIADLKKKYSKK